jgi:hypothetical protein
LFGDTVRLLHVELTEPRPHPPHFGQAFLQLLTHGNWHVASLARQEALNAKAYLSQELRRTCEGGRSASIEFIGGLSQPRGTRSLHRLMKKLRNVGVLCRHGTRPSMHPLAVSR